MINRKTKYIATSILAGTMLFAVGCNSETTNNNQEASHESFKNDNNFVEDTNAIYGEIININKENITLALGEFNMKGKGERPQGERPQGEIPNGERPPGEIPQGEIPNGERPPGEIPQGEIPNGEMPQGERPQGEKPNGDMPTIDREDMEIISLTGEEKIITITDDITISKMNMRVPNSNNQDSNDTTVQLSLTDLSVGDIIKVTYNDDNTEIKSMEVMNTPAKDNKKSLKNKKSTDFF